eukprot:2876305-Karenia_brevis.AAC.1
MVMMMLMLLAVCSQAHELVCTSCVPAQFFELQPVVDEDGAEGGVGAAWGHPCVPCAAMK